MRPLLLGIALLGSASLATAQTAQPAKPLERKTYHANERVGYARAVLVGNTLHISGTVAPGKTMAEQVEGIYKFLEKTLADHGLTFQHVVRENVYTTDIEAFTGQIELRKKYYNGVYPAATWMEIKRLLKADALVEIEMTAVVP